eukprot:COSAG06_NODE_25_length_32611_cov_10.451160_16_plen_85_part_00
MRFPHPNPSALQPEHMSISRPSLWETETKRPFISTSFQMKKYDLICQAREKHRENVQEKKRQPSVFLPHLAERTSASTSANQGA